MGSDQKSAKPVQYRDVNERLESILDMFINSFRNELTSFMKMKTATGRVCGLKTKSVLCCAFNKRMMNCVYLIFLVVMFGTTMRAGYGDEATPDSFLLQSQNSTAPVTYNLGIKLENVGEIDRQSGSYELIFWVTLRSDGIDMTKNPPPTPDRFDFTNGYVEEISGIHLEPNFYKFKVRGIFYNSIDLHQYPFEKIDLAIHVEPYYPLTSDKLIFVVDKTYSGKSDSTTASVPGWELGSGEFVSVIESYPWGEFSHLEAHYIVESTFFSSFMKKLFPIIVLMGFAFSTYFMPAKAFGERLGATTAVLLSSIFFHSSFLLGEIPPIGYMTMADKIMIIAYTLFTITLIVTLIHKYNTDITKKLTDDDAIKLDRKMIVFTPIILVGISALVFLLPS